MITSIEVCPRVGPRVVLAWGGALRPFDQGALKLAAMLARHEVTAARGIVSDNYVPTVRGIEWGIRFRCSNAGGYPNLMLYAHEGEDEHISYEAEPAGRGYGRGCEIVVPALIQKPKDLPEGEGWELAWMLACVAEARLDAHKWWGEWPPYDPPEQGGVWTRRPAFRMAWEGRCSVEGCPNTCRTDEAWEDTPRTTEGLRGRLPEGWLFEYHRNLAYPEVRLDQSLLICPDHCTLWWAFRDAVKTWDAQRRVVRKRDWFSRLLGLMTGDADACSVHETPPPGPPPTSPFGVAP